MLGCVADAPAVLPAAIPTGPLLSPTVLPCLSCPVEYGNLPAVVARYESGLRTSATNAFAPRVPRTAPADLPLGIGYELQCCIGAISLRQVMDSPEHTTERNTVSADHPIRIRSAPGIHLSPDQAELLARVVGDDGAAGRATSRQHSLLGRRQDDLARRMHDAALGRAKREGCISGGQGRSRAG